MGLFSLGCCSYRLRVNFMGMCLMIYGCFGFVDIELC
jgi:hypothetical protein